MSYSSPRKDLLGLLTWIYYIVPIDPLIHLSAILTAIKSQAPTQISKMKGKCAVWNWLRLKVTVSTSFDESSTQIVNYSMFTFSTNFIFSFPVE